MVEQTRQRIQVVSLQAGPGEVDTSILFGLNLRISDQAARAVGRQLAVIGDELEREWAGREPQWPPAPLHLLRPAHELTRIVYQDIHRQLWNIQGLSAAAKAWIASAAHGKGTIRADSWAAMVSRCKPSTCPGWTKGVLVTAALAAAVTFSLHRGWSVTLRGP
ncbi:bcl-2-interacting killer [Nelusetta ayraudi]|uniref:bcl-2-interacting killer n=1 Tax=Nelusetta ayraudi TaxID=303726 RepID=UPI003F6FF756